MSKKMENMNPNFRVRFHCVPDATSKTGFRIEYASLFYVNPRTKELTEVERIQCDNAEPNVDEEDYDNGTENEEE